MGAGGRPAGLARGQATRMAQMPLFDRIVSYSETVCSTKLGPRRFWEEREGGKTVGGRSPAGARTCRPMWLSPSLSNRPAEYLGAGHERKMQDWCRTGVLFWVGDRRWLVADLACFVTHLSHAINCFAHQVMLTASPTCCDTTSGPGLGRECALIAASALE